MSPEHRNALPSDYLLGTYKIQSVLGDGGFGITYLATDLQLSLPVAIKEYFPNELAVRKGESVQAKSPKDKEDFTWGLQRFSREAQALAQFKHPNIVRVLHFFYANNTAYLVMEYEVGQNLASYLKSGDTATEEELLLFLPALLDGLETIHNQGFLHRDIKPANIYLRAKDYSPLLIDFGSARHDLGRRSRSITTIVTPGYAPFEQYQSDASQQGVWTDIYSLGAVLYRLISGRVPPEAPERVAALMHNKPDPLVPAKKLAKSHYSHHLLEAIDWALQIPEHQRPANVAVWRNKLLWPTLPLFSHFPWLKELAVMMGLLLIFGSMWLIYVTKSTDSPDDSPEEVEVAPEPNLTVPNSPVAVANTPVVEPPNPILPPEDLPEPTENSLSPAIAELYAQATQRSKEAENRLPTAPLRIVTGAGVYLRKTPSAQASKLGLLHFGTVVSEVRALDQAGETWHEVLSHLPEKGWLSAHYSRSLRAEQRPQMYVEIGKQKLQQERVSFGDLVDVCNFLQRASEEVPLEESGELQWLFLQVLQRSLSLMPTGQAANSPYQEWLEKQANCVEFENGKWQVKEWCFKELQERYHFLPIATYPLPIGQ